ncbi:MAG: hypothetical protein ACRDPD_17830 [Streptosporangiaceae bacterium]
MFFVLLLALGCAARVLLCRRFEPLPATRLADLLRGSRVLPAAVAITSVSEWIAVAAGANRAHWNGATWLQVALLAVVSALGVRAGLAQHRAGAAPGPGRVFADTRAGGPGGYHRLVRGPAAAG